MAALRTSVIPDSAAGNIVPWLSALIILGLVLFLVRWFAGPRRRRHQVHPGIHPQDAFLEAGLGAPTKLDATRLDSMGNTTILPDWKRVVTGPIELDPRDVEIAEALGSEHPMAAAGRHRAYAKRRVIALPDDAAAALLAPPATEPSPASITPDTPNEADLVVASPVDLSATEQGPLTAVVASPSPSIADQRYQLDWGQDRAGLTSGYSSGDLDVIPGDQHRDHDWWATQTSTGSRLNAWWGRLGSQTKAADNTPSMPITAPALLPAQVPAQRVPSHAGQPSTEATFRLSVAQRNALAKAQARLSGAANRITLAELVTREAAALIESETTALVVRSLEGPRVLWQHPHGDMWGQQTLAALLSTGSPLRTVLRGDPLSEEETTALLAVPVASAGDLAGLIICRRSGQRPFTVSDQDILDRLARVAGAALDALTRRGMLRAEEENTDPVTGLAPNDSMMHDLRVALRTQREHHMPVSLVVIGLDGMEELRAGQGDQIADHTLKQVAEAVCRELRVGDVPYRKDAAELAVLLAATGYDDALVVAARHQRTAAEALSHLTQVDVTARVVVVPVSGTVEDVVRAAEATLSTERMDANR